MGWGILLVPFPGSPPSQDAEEILGHMPGRRRDPGTPAEDQDTEEILGPQHDQEAALIVVRLSSMGDKQDWEAALITDGVYHSSLVRTLSSHY